MVGVGAARLVSDQARIFASWRCSSCAKALSKNLAWRCQAGSLVSGVSGESGGRRHAGKEARGVVDGYGVGGARRQRDREQQGEGERHNAECETHLHSRPGDAAAGRAARLRKTA